jgi:trigger factor
VPGFRKGKAPRFIIENYFGRSALLEEASDDLINKTFQKVREQENIEMVGQPALESIEPSDTFRFKVVVPVPPTVNIPDYRNIRMPLEVEPVTDETVERALEARRERHVVLKELDEPRPAQQGDHLTVKLYTYIDGEPLEEYPEDQELPDSNLVMEPERLVPELYEGLIGMSGDEEREIVAHMPEDHENEQVAGKDVTFKVKLVGIQERVLPDWEEVPTLEEIEGGTLEDLRTNTREVIETNTRTTAENELVDGFIDEMIAQTEYDIPDALIRETADEMLEQQGQQFSQYGITLDQMLQFRGQSRDDAIDELLEPAEDRLKKRLALQVMVKREGIEITPEELTEETSTVLADYDEEQSKQIVEQMGGQLYTMVANTVLDRKLRQRIKEIATGEAPPLPEPGSEPTEEETIVPESAAPAPTSVAADEAQPAEETETNPDERNP